MGLLSSFPSGRGSARTRDPQDDYGQSLALSGVRGLLDPASFPPAARNGPDPYANLVLASPSRTNAAPAVASPVPPGARPDPGMLRCQGVAIYSSVGPKQARADGAFHGHGVNPVDGTVAMGDTKKVFGLDHAAMARIAPQVVIQPEGLDAARYGGPDGPYTVGDIGDKHIRNSPTTRFDIYRFKDLQEARRFGKLPRNTTITLPAVAGAHCPPDFRRIP